MDARRRRCYLPPEEAGHDLYSTFYLRRHRRRRRALRRARRRRGAGVPAVKRRPVADAERDVLARAGNVSVRRMRDGADDYETMARWLSDERVLEFVYGRDNPFAYRRVVAKWGPRARREGPVCPCIIELDDRKTCPERSRRVGYIQYYPVHDPAEYELEDATDTYGIDLFIGEPERWNRGIGTRALSALVADIFAELGARGSGV